MQGKDRKDGYAGEWMGRWPNGQADEWMDKGVSGCMDGRAHGQLGR